MAPAFCFGNCLTAVLKSNAPDSMGDTVVVAGIMMLGPSCSPPHGFGSCADIRVTPKLRQLMLEVVACHSASIWSAFKRLLATTSHMF